MKAKEKKTYVYSILLPLLLGGATGFLTRKGVQAYESAAVVKPLLTPPGFLFPIVWSLLYILMGVSAARIRLLIDSRDKGEALLLYYAQLFVNILWSFFFFTFQAYLFSFVWLLLLWFLIFAMLRAFFALDKKAGYLQLPYLLWVSFAAYLNLAVYLLNR